MSSFSNPAIAAGPPGVTLDMNMPSSFGLYGVEPRPPAIDKPNPLSPRSKRISNVRSTGAEP